MGKTKLGCPVCGVGTREELEAARGEGFVFVLFNGCGHRFDLEDLDGSIREQSKMMGRLRFGTGH